MLDVTSKFRQLLSSLGASVTNPSAESTPRVQPLTEPRVLPPESRPSPKRYPRSVRTTLKDLGEL